MSLQAMEERDGTISLLRKRLEQAERQQRVQEERRRADEDRLHALKTDQAALQQTVAGLQSHICTLEKQVFSAAACVWSWPAILRPHGQGYQAMCRPHACQRAAIRRWA